MDLFNIHISGNKNKPKLAFLHGLMGSASNWRGITSFFKNDFCILTYDQRGHGSSFHPSSGFAPEDYAKDLEQILDDLGWQSCFLVGHSMGGRAALSFAAHYPQRVQGLVIEDISMFPQPEAAEKIKRLINIVPEPFKSRAVARNFFQNRFLNLLPDHPNASVLGQYFYTNMKEMEDGRMTWRFYKKGIVETARVGREINFWSDFESVKSPFLIIRGGLSDEISESEVLEIKKRGPHVELVTIEGAGHWVHHDKPEEFKQALSKFFSRESE